MKQKSSVVFIFLFAILLTSCLNENENTFVPKPKGYNRIDLPKQEYHVFEEKNYPYSFEISTYAKALKDTNGLQGEFWAHIYYPQFKSTIEITYEDLTLKGNELSKMLNIAHKLTAKHQIKATKIEQTIIKRNDGTSGAVYELEGDVPSQFQFIYTDSSKHFLRGAIYFATATQNDSLAPVIEFMKKDVIQMLNTIKWKK